MLDLTRARTIGYNIPMNKLSDASFECSNKGFHMTFDNNWSISVQIGAMNYCDNKGGLFEKYEDQAQYRPQECPNAEIAVFSPNGDYALPNDVEGYLKPEVVAAVIGFVAGLSATDCTKAVEDELHDIVVNHPFV